MARLATLKPRVQVLDTRRATSLRIHERLTGRALQAMRLHVWASNPCCAMCGKVTMYPHGFELDHVAALDSGGSNERGNLQVLCAGENGCHAIKTATDMGYATR